MHGGLRSNIFVIPPDLAQSVLKLSINSQTCAWHQFLSFYKYKCGGNLWLMPQPSLMMMASIFIKTPSLG